MVMCLLFADRAPRSLFLLGMRLSPSPRAAEISRTAAFLLTCASPMRALRSALVCAVVAVGIAPGCVPSTSRQGVGGYCHRDDQCLDGLRCIERVCREGTRPQPDGGPVDAWWPPDPPDTGYFPEPDGG
ncbi:Hypothetical protein I5071_8820 [Sandaracinus amylolyticus]|nr:Hypothetical protein I5071_8820 [Sandaracinus amylolyticus]